MGENGQGTARWTATVLTIILFASLFTASCAREPAPEPPAPQDGAPLPVVRVRLMADHKSVKLQVTGTPTVRTAVHPRPLRLKMTPRKSATLALTPQGWTIGGVPVPGDGILTTKVKTRMVDARRFNPLHVKVVSDDGTVYLMGIVTRKEADTASEIDRTTSGVRRVVRMFEYRD